MGKVYSKVLRRSLVPFFEKFARSDQHGGVKGRGTETASLTARVLVRRFSKIGKSFAVLFVDARSAFYSLFLEQVLGATDQESALNNVLQKISDLFPDVLAQAAKHRAVERHELGTQHSRLQGWCVGQLASSQLDFSGRCAEHSMLLERHSAR